MPANLPAGKKVQVSLQSLGNLPIDTGTREMKVVKQSRGKVWMLDSETGIGYILMMVEE